MIMGHYPCCDEPLFLEYQGPGFAKDQCPNCKAVVWHKMSNLDPCSYTEEQFLSTFEVDEASHSIKEKK